MKINYKDDGTYAGGEAENKSWEKIKNIMNADGVKQLTARHHGRSLLATLHRSRSGLYLSELRMTFSAEEKVAVCLPQYYHPAYRNSSPVRPGRWPVRTPFQTSVDEYHFHTEKSVSVPWLLQFRQAPLDNPGWLLITGT